MFKPIERFRGRCIAVIQPSDDDDDKLIVAPEGADYSDEQVLALTEFQERFFKSTITREFDSRQPRVTSTRKASS